MTRLRVHQAMERWPDQCDEPCSSQGHRCPASVALIEAATRIAREEEK